MPDYKEQYLAMVRAAETAIRVLVEAQQNCEDAILDEPEASDAGQETGRT